MHDVPIFSQEYIDEDGEKYTQEYASIIIGERTNINCDIDSEEVWAKFRELQLELMSHISRMLYQDADALEIMKKLKRAHDDVVQGGGPTRVR